MLQSAWLFIGAIALIATISAVYTTQDGIAVISGVAGFLAWGVFTFGAFQVRVVTQCCVFTRTMPAAAILAVALSLIPAYIALTGPIELVARARNPDMEDV